MTQSELAQKLNYTDKAISKWERGESIPDAVILKKIADIFGVSIDYLFTKEHTSIFSKTDGSFSRLRRRISNRKFILAICLVLVWLIATLVFVITHSAVKSRLNILSFVFALPVTFIVWLVLNSVWFSKRRNFLIISFLLWSVLFSISITFALFGINVWYIMILGIPGQAIIVLWSRIRILGRKITRKGSAQPEPEDTPSPGDQDAG